MYHEVIPRPRAGTTLPPHPARPSAVPCPRSFPVTKSRLLRSAAALLLATVGVSLRSPDALGQKGKGSGSAAPQWIWADKAGKNQAVWFRKEFTVTQPVNAARIQATCDNQMTVYLDGQEVLAGDDWEAP